MRLALVRRGPQGALAATVALVGVLAVWGVRDYEHRRAVNALQARVYEGADPIRASAYPYWINPFKWHGVVETQDFFATMQVDSSVPELDPEGKCGSAESRKRLLSRWPPSGLTWDESIWTGPGIRLPRPSRWRVLGGVHRSFSGPSLRLSRPDWQGRPGSQRGARP